MLEITDLHKSFKIGPTRLQVLEGVSLEVGNGEFVAIIGRSGGGKSTLMNIIGLLDGFDSGTYRLDNQNVAEMDDNTLSRFRNQKIGFVFQSYFLMPRLTVLENVCLPLVYRGMVRKKKHEMAAHYLEKVGMADKLSSRPSELSGGQCQRVAIARALVGNPSIVLADEPTGALDAAVGQEIIDLFIQLNGEEGITLLVITHDHSVARQSRRILKIESGSLFATDSHGTDQ